MDRFRVMSHPGSESGALRLLVATIVAVALAFGFVLLDHPSDSR